MVSSSNRQILFRGSFGGQFRWDKLQFGPAIFSRRARADLKTAPAVERHRRHHDKCELAGDESAEPWKSFLHESIGMESNAEHVYAEPRKAGNDIAEDGHDHEAALPDEPTPARVEDYGAPENDQDRAVLLRIPAPETAPRLIGPDTAENRADEAEESRETNDAVGHARKRIGRFLFKRRREDAADDVNHREHSGEEHGGITSCNCDHVSGEPDVGVEHRLQHLEGV